jgi:sugar phosphate isomerase/epimerase
VHLSHHHHLAYCTNIHPAESWPETFEVVRTDVLTVRDKLRTAGHLAPAAPFAIGLRLSALAASQLLADDHLPAFRDWLAAENAYVFTINGFPYGAFHGTRVKENVYRPDWTTEDRLTYTNKLFTIIAALTPPDAEGSVSTLPGSFKEFQADESAIFTNLEACARHIESLANETGKDLHLGLEPEPLGHFENTTETLAFFERFLAAASDPDLIQRRIGINYDTCHFALEFDDCAASLDALRHAGLRISKVHLSSALEFTPTDPAALQAIQPFDEPTYLHQVIVSQDDDLPAEALAKEGRPSHTLTRFKDLPDFISHLNTEHCQPTTPSSARIHFHIPLYSDPAAPLRSTQQHARDLLAYRRNHPDFCSHFEIETYTWGVLPDTLQQPITDQIAQEYAWVLNHL